MTRSSHARATTINADGTPGPLLTDALSAPAAVWRPSLVRAGLLGELTQVADGWKAT